MAAAEKVVKGMGADVAVEEGADSEVEAAAMAAAAMGMVGEVVEVREEKVVVVS